MRFSNLTIGQFKKISIDPWFYFVAKPDHIFTGLKSSWLNCITIVYGTVSIVLSEAVNPVSLIQGFKNYQTDFFIMTPIAFFVKKVFDFFKQLVKMAQFQS